MIVRLNGTEIAFGGHVHADRLKDGRTEPLAQPVHGENFVAIVESLIRGILRKLVQQMPYVVQQRCHNGGCRSGFLFCKHGRLQGVLQLRNGLASVPRGTSRIEQLLHRLAGVVERKTHGYFLIKSSWSRTPGWSGERVYFLPASPISICTHYCTHDCTHFGILPLTSDQANLQNPTPSTTRGDTFWAIWSVAAAFGTYFCMYGFRKPFTAADFAEANTVAGVGFKTVAVSTQVLGYTLSKFLGIKVISEMPRRRRAVAIIVLISVAEFGLLLFGVLPRPWNVIGLFFNGLALGMVFGLVLGFLEGRRMTEALTAGLCASFILADGVTKSVGSWLLVHGIAPDWMPSVAGLVFLGPLCVGVLMLTKIPPPNFADIAARAERYALDRRQRWSLYGKYAAGLTLLVTIYLLVTIMRSVRADFAPELWQGLGIAAAPSIFTRSELLVALGVLVASGSAVCIRDNRKAFFVALTICVLGFAMIAATLLLQQARLITAFPFMVLIGLGLYLPYVTMHTTIFERLLAMTRERGNLGFLMYVADAFGYLGYVVVMVTRNLWTSSSDFLGFFIWMSWLATGVSMACLIVCWKYFADRRSAIAPTPAVEGAA